ncbi:MAG: hypothetical protein LBR17_09410 [Bacteroidales bacterium]|jgi:hypothetical protein|nr:hypothetical protein [Bacteroidales bacterium]
MKHITALFLSLILSVSVTVAQSQYVRIDNTSAGDTIIYNTGKENVSIVTGIDRGGFSVVSISTSKTLQYRSPDLGTQFSFAFFYNAKLKEGFLFVHKQLEFSKGCEVFHIDKNGLTHSGNLPVAAYNKLNKTMDYNSILPYISIVKVSNRIILSLETPLLVLHPDTREEQIITSKNISCIFKNNSFEIQNYE